MDNKRHIGLVGLWDRFKLWWFEKSKPSKVSISQRIVNIVFLAFRGNTRKSHVVLPANFDLVQHKTQYPPENYGFRRGGVVFRDFKVHYILHLLSSIPARNSDLITENGFIPIHTPTLQSHMRDYKLYIDYLVGTGVLICDDQYIPGEKSLGYKWSDQYENSASRNEEILISDYSKDSQNEDTEDRENYPYLFYWYDQKKLLIDERAYDYAESIRRIKMQDTTHESWDWNRDKHQHKHPFTQYMAVLRNINKISSLDYEAHIDDNIHRLHSVLTNIQKDYRNFITYDGLNLVGIDIKNCQPYLTCLILNPGFWQKDSGLPLTLFDLPENIQLLFKSELLFAQLERFFTTLTEPDISDYKQVVSSGQIYEEIMRIADSQQHSGQPSTTRSNAKILMFYLLFSSNRGQHEDPMINKLKKIFTIELYPKVAELFRIIKQNYSDCQMEDSHSRLSRVLQAIESTVILHKCCKRIWDEREHSIPIFTIHDSIVTTLEHHDYVLTVMREEMARFIGIAPELSHEYWNVESLNQELLPR